MPDHLLARLREWGVDTVFGYPGDGINCLLTAWGRSEVLRPAIARAAVEVLEVAGFTVAVPTEPLCCALTWISSGQLGVARRMLQRTVAALRPSIEAGTLVVGLEPACAAVFRSDAAELLPEDKDVAHLRSRFVILAEALLHHAPRPRTPEKLDRAAIVQAHCHHHAVLKFDADLEAMERAGVDAHRLDSGCCGLAGNFGFEARHYEVSMACAEQALLPNVREAGPDTLVLADGFSCRTQIQQGVAGRPALHLAEVLNMARHWTATPARDTAVRDGAARNGHASGYRKVAGALAGGLAAARVAWVAQRTTHQRSTQKEAR